MSREFYARIRTMFTNTNLFSIFTVMFASVCVKHGVSQSVDDFVNLKKHLFQNASYHSSVRPAMNQSHSTEVKIKFAMTSITDFDDDSGILMFTGHLVVTWTDEIHIWNPVDFAGITRLAVAREKIWMPTVVQLTHAGNSGFVVSTAWLFCNGTVYLILGGGFLAYCDLKNHNWPLDQQTCLSTLLITDNDASEIELSLLTDEVDMKGFGEHGAWQLVNPKSNIIGVKDTDVSIDFVAYQLTLSLQRRSNVIMLHSAVPFFLTTLLNTVVYFVPIKSGERLTFAITILLTFVFFTNIVKDELPKTAVTTPFVSVIMAVMNCLCTFNVLVSVVFSRFSNDFITPVPDCLKTFTRAVYRMKINRLLGTKRDKLVEKRTASARTILKPMELEDISGDETLNNGTETGSSKKSVYDFEITWATVIDAFDILIFFIFLAIAILVMVIAAILIHIVRQA